MLNFILGRAASGKTYTVLNNIKADVEAGREVVLLIPEQFSFECERAVLHALGDNAATNVNVLSFSRMCDEVQRLAGGNAFGVMTDCDKIVTMRTALKTVAGDLKLWKRYVASPRFASTMIDAIDELKTCSVTVEQLSACVNDTLLGKKLAELTKIFLTYDALIHNRFIDPSDRLTHLYNRLADFPFFKNKCVYIDSFKDFTGQQYRILDRIFSQADSVTVSLLINNPESSATDDFSNVRMVYKRLCSAAGKFGVKISEPLLLQKNYYNSKELSVLESCLCRERVELNGRVENITICRADNVFNEAEFAARNIRRLVREDGYRYEDFVIIARDTAPYENAVLNACRKNGVSCFFDERKPVEYSPVCVFVLSALDAVLRINTRNIMSFLKTGLAGMSFQEISELENYVYLWNVDGALWYDSWQMNPDGFVTGKEAGDTEERLENINALRVRALAPLNTLYSVSGGTAVDFANGILQLLDECDVSESLSRLAAECTGKGDIESADYLRRSWDCFVDILDSVVRCSGDKAMTVDEFSDTLRLAISSVTIGTIPQMLDQVTFGAADRIRPSRPKIAFILGMNQGVFPQGLSQTGIFAAFERKKLISLGIDIRDNVTEYLITENLLVYTSLCCPSDKLFISYSAAACDGNAAEPSSVIKRIKGVFTDIEELVESSRTITQNRLPETEATVFSYFCAAYNSSYDTVSAVKDAVTGRAVLEKRINALESSRNSGSGRLTGTAAALLYGDNIKISASGFEAFHRCRFSYFCKYGLRLKKLQPASLDVLQRGTIVHFVLEKYVERFKESFDSLDDGNIERIVSDLLEEYLAGIKGIKQIRTARFEYLLDIIRDSVTAVAVQITAELKQSEFVPDRCELSIGDRGDLPSVKLRLGSSVMLRLQGSVDRVDVWNGYVRIIDYKTGTKVFRMPDILCGLNMQMLIYLYALLRGDNSSYRAMTPAGVLYMPSKKERDGKSMRMNGMLLRNMDLVLAMERDNAGNFIPPLKINKSDGEFGKSNTYVDFDTFETVFDYITVLIEDMGSSLLCGDISVTPLDDTEHGACDYCDYAAICRIEDRPHGKIRRYSNDDAVKLMKEGAQNGIQAHKGSAGGN